MERGGFNIVEQQITEVLKEQKSLEFSEKENNFELHGKYTYSLEVKQLIYEGDQKIKIIIPKNFPNGIPKVYLFDAPKEVEHVYKDNEVCLATNGEQIDFLHTKPTVQSFIKKFVEPFIFSIDYYKDYNSYPFGEREHGYKGALNYYLEDWKLTYNQYLEMLHIVIRGKYRGHTKCFCESGTKVRNCHGKRLLPILKNEELKKLFLEEGYQILREKK